METAMEDSPAACKLDVMPCPSCDPYGVMAASNSSEQRNGLERFVSALVTARSKAALFSGMHLLQDPHPLSIPIIATGVALRLIASYARMPFRSKRMS